METGLLFSAWQATQIPQDPCLSDNLWSLVLRMTFRVKKLSGSQVRLLPILLEMTTSSHLKIDAKGRPSFYSLPFFGERVTRRCFLQFHGVFVQSCKDSVVKRGSSCSTQSPQNNSHRSHNNMAPEIFLLKWSFF